MENLYATLKEKGYTRIKFKISKTQHLLIKGKINGVTGNFILDTGASNSCVGFEGISLFEFPLMTPTPKLQEPEEPAWQPRLP